MREESIQNGIVSPGVSPLTKGETAVGNNMVQSTFDALAQFARVVGLISKQFAEARCNVGVNSGI